MALNAYQNRESPSWRILEYLQRKGAATIKELEDVLGVTTTAVRQQLQTLQADGYVERTCTCRCGPPASCLLAHGEGA